MIRGVILQHAGKAGATSLRFCVGRAATAAWELRSGAAEVALCTDSAERGEMAVKSLPLTVDSNLVSRAVRGA